MEMSYWRNTIRKCVFDRVFEREGKERTHYGQSLKIRVHVRRYVAQNMER